MTYDYRPLSRTGMRLEPDPTRCAAAVTPAGDWRSRQCSRRPNGPGGKYCAQHSPEARERRERDERIRRESRRDADIARAKRAALGGVAWSFGFRDADRLRTALEEWRNMEDEGERS